MTPPKPKPKPNPKSPASSLLLAACASGSELAALLALRDELAEAMTRVPTYAIAPIAARLQAVLERIGALEALAAPAESVADDLVARRAARRAAAQLGAGR